MPYRNYDKRVKAYDLTVIPDVVRTKFDAKKSFMLDQQQEMQKILTDVEIKVKEILDDAGIVGNFRIPYLNYARALIRASGHQHGIALRKVATAEKSKFVALGCDPEILDKITEVVIGALAY